MTLDRLTAIVRTRYETGAYGDAVFRMATSTWERLRAHFPPPQPAPQTSPYWFPSDPLAQMLGIPFIPDDDLPDGVWQLAVRGTGGTWLVIESGTAGTGRDLMDDLVTWLRAQLDEDERVALAAAGTQDGSPEWTFSPSSGEGSMWTGATVWPIGLSGVHSDGFLDDEAGEHIARHDPARELAEVEAKRRILDLHYIIWRDIGWLERDEGEIVEGSAELPVCGYCVPKYSSFPTRQGVPEGPCLTVRLLALPYAGRPGYREAWRP